MATAIKSAIILFCTIVMAIRPAVAEPPSMKVGVILPLTGPMAEWGKSIQIGIEFANKRLASKVQFIFEDEVACDAAKALAAAQKLIHLDKVDMIMAGCLNGLKAFLPVAQKAKVLVVSLGLVDDDLASLAQGTVLTPSASITAEADGISRMLKQDGKKRLVLMRVEDNFTEQILNGLKKYAARDGWELVSDERLTFDTKDFRSSLLKISRQKADAVLVYMSTEQVVAAMRQLKDLRINSLAPYAGYVIEADPPSPQQMPVLNGVRYAAAVTPVNDELTKYLAENGSKETFQTRVAADAVADTYKAYERCKDSKNKSICFHDAITSRTSGDAAFSGSFTYDKNGIAARVVKGKIVREAKFEWFE